MSDNDAEKYWTCDFCHKGLTASDIHDIHDHRVRCWTCFDVRSAAKPDTNGLSKEHNIGKDKMIIEIVSASADYKRPEPEWKVGDRVVALREFELATVTAVHETYRDRADQVVVRKNYHITFDDFGESIRFGCELRAESEVTPEARENFHEINRRYIRDCDLLRQDYNRRLLDIHNVYQREMTLKEIAARTAGNETKVP